MKRNIKEFILFRTSDGALHENLQAAERHESDLRAAFEAWACPSINIGYDLRQHPNGDYIYNKTQAAWRGFRAGAAYKVYQEVKEAGL